MGKCYFNIKKDTAGQEKYRALNNMYYQNSHGAVVVFDLGDAETFQQAKNWIQELKMFLDKPIPIIIAGNKKDLPNRAVSDEDLENLSKENNAAYFYTSAKTGENLNDMVTYLAKEVAKNTVEIPKRGQSVPTE